MQYPSVAILHYSAPPVVGGVESVMQAHARLLVERGRRVALVAGRGPVSQQEAKTTLPRDVDFTCIPLMDSQHSRILKAEAVLEQGRVPAEFPALVEDLAARLAPVLETFDHVIIHNIFTKHFNLPLTVALHRLLDRGVIRNAVAWCHDFTWTSPSSGYKVHPGYPWDLLRTRREDTHYVVVSEQRRRTLAQLFGCSLETITIGYNGVDPRELLGLSDEGWALIRRLDLLKRDLILLMPVRVTQAKNVEFALRVVAALKARDVRPMLVATGPPDPHDETSMAYYRSLQSLRAELEVENEMRFVFESGPAGDTTYTIGLECVGDLFRVSDVLFMPSHREGFGMPVLEAGLVGIPVFSAETVPAAVEIGRENVVTFKPEIAPETLAERLLDWVANDAAHQLRRRVRQTYTWDAIYMQTLHPLLAFEEAS